MWGGVGPQPGELSWRNASIAGAHFPIKAWEQLAPIFIVEKEKGY